MNAKHAPGPRSAAGANGRDARFYEVLARWPVLREDWARDLEQRRVATQSQSTSGGVRTGVRPGAPTITLREAINRVVGLPDDHGAAEEALRRESSHT